jgi:glutamate-1-semialdehyde 2,1-aminomutase
VRVAGGTSTGSKRPAALFGGLPPGPPPVGVRSEGARVWGPDGRAWLDFVMALGAVALGYGHPAVRAAAHAAVDRGTVGSLPPPEEEELAALLAEAMPWLESVRFLKTGAEAVAAAVRLARVATGRDEVLGAGYHGWLDWCSREEGVPAAVAALHDALPFNDVERGRAMIRARAGRLACVVAEPVVDGPPDPAWLAMLREETARAGALLVFDEIKTGFRLGLAGAAGRWGGSPDLVVLGKALANGFPLAAVGGRAAVMAGVERTWISSTLATEVVALAAALATVRTLRAERVPDHLARTGALLHEGLVRLAAGRPDLVEGVGGIPEMCYLRFRDPGTGARVATACLRQGVLFKRTAYNFVSLAHGPAEVAAGLAALEEALAGC